jgi:2-iminobutanoate/2-iminopropanoate deaminase
VEAIVAQNIAQPKGFYSQAVRAGEFLFIAGQLPLDKDGSLVTGSISVQAAQALENVKAIVEAAGGTLSNIVQCTIYISDLTHWSEVNRVYTKFLSGVAVPPARAIVPVKEMHFGSLIEIQAVAHL